MADLNSRRRTKLEEEIPTHFSAEEIAGLQSKVQAQGLPSRVAQEIFLEQALELRKREVKRSTAQLQEDPDFQTAVGKRQLPEETDLDLSREARGFAGGIAQNISPLLGGQGGAVDIEGEVKDAQEAFPGQDVRVISVPSATGFDPVVVVDQEGTFVPVNRPGLSPGDFGQMVGDIGTLEGVGSLATLLPPLKGAGFIGRALATMFGSALGGAADEVLNEGDATKLGNVIMRASTGMVGAVVGEVGGDVLKAGANLARGSINARPGSLEAQAINRALEAQIIGGKGSVAAGQVSPSSFVGKLRTRWTQFSPALKEQVLNQRVGVGQRLDEVLAQYKDADGVEQALLVGGLDRQVLSDLEEDLGKDLADRALKDLNAGGTQSRSGAGRETQEALFGVTDKEKVSYRTLGQAKLHELENDVIDAADTPVDFSINLLPSVRAAKKALADFPLLQRDPDRIVTEVETGRDILGGGINKVRAKYHADLAFVLQTLNELPEVTLQNKGTYRVHTGGSGKLESDPVRVDGDGTLRVPYAARGEDGNIEKGKALKTYELSGVETVRMLRGKLRDFFGNELLPANGSEVQLARKLYLQLGEAMESVEGAPEFTTAMRRYNRTSKNFLDRMELLQTAGLAKEGNAQGIITSFTAGAMDFKTLSTMKNVLRRTGETGGEGWAAFRNASTRDLIQNPEKIENLTIEPKTSGLVYSPEEVRTLRNYAGMMDDLNKQGFVPIARRASGERGKALALFQTVQDNQHFGLLWNKLGSKEQNLMRFAIAEDLMLKSRDNFAGKEGVWSPAKYSNNIQALLSGDTGVRARMIFPEDTVKELEDVGTLAAFYKEVQGQGDVGASIRAQQVAGGAIPEGADLATAPISTLGISALGAVTINFERMLASSLAEGTLGRVFRPALRKPIPAIQKIPAYTALAGSLINSQLESASTDFMKSARIAGESAVAEEVKSRRTARRGRNR